MLHIFCEHCVKFCKHSFDFDNLPLASWTCLVTVTHLPLHTVPGEISFILVVP